jgi:hypothetical protein
MKIEKINVLSINNKMLKLRDWVDINKLYWCYLSRNPNAIELLEKNQYKLCWFMLSLNPNAIELLKRKSR